MLDTLPQLFDGTRMFDLGVNLAIRVEKTSSIKNPGEPTIETTQSAETLLGVCGWPMTQLYISAYIEAIRPVAIALATDLAPKLAAVTGFSIEKIQNSIGGYLACVKSAIQLVGEKLQNDPDRIKKLIDVTERAVQLMGGNQHTLPPTSPLNMLDAAAQNFPEKKAGPADSWDAVEKDMGINAVFDRKPVELLHIATFLDPEKAPPNPTGKKPGSCTDIVAFNLNKLITAALNRKAKYCNPHYGFVGSPGSQLYDTAERNTKMVLLGTTHDLCARQVASPALLAARIRRDFLAVTTLNLLETVDLVFLFSPAIAQSEDIETNDHKESFYSTINEKITGFKRKADRADDYMLNFWEKTEQKKSLFMEVQKDDDGTLVSLPWIDITEKADHALTDVITPFLWSLTRSIDHHGKKGLLDWMAEKKAFVPMPSAKDYVDQSAYKRARETGQADMQLY